MTIILFNMSACTSNHNFRGQLKEIDDETKEILLKSFPKHIESIYSPLFAVVDTVALFYNTNNETAYEAFKLSTGEQIGKFCPIGHGQGEYIAISPIRQIYQEKGEYKTLMFAPNEAKILIWNISESLRSGHTIYEYVGDYSKKDNPVSYSKQVIIGKDSALFYTPSVHISSSNRITIPKYLIRSVKSNDQINEIQLFDNVVENADARVLPESFFDSSFSLKPDKKQFVEAMNWLPQINIVDVKTGKIEGYRKRSFQDENIFSTNMENALFCYKCVVSDDQYIYALWAGKKKNDLHPEIGYQTIDIYDWNGKLVHKYYVKDGINELAIDVQDGTLYGWNVEQQMIYKYEITLKEI